MRELDQHTLILGELVMVQIIPGTQFKIAEVHLGPIIIVVLGHGFKGSICKGFVLQVDVVLCGQLLGLIGIIVVLNGTNIVVLEGIDKGGM